MPTLEQRLADMQSYLQRLDATLAGLEESREAILREPKPSAEMRARLRALDSELERFKEEARRTKFELDELLTEVGRQELGSRTATRRPRRER
jgi:uncharacterized small protein (DUF1192 family)